jgi:CheY-like chemotaxis protein
VLVTSSATREDIERFERSVADGYLTKPINTRIFAREVSGYLPTE